MKTGIVENTPVQLLIFDLQEFEDSHQARKAALLA